MTITVLIVDPAASFRRGLAATLTAAGYAVDEADSLPHRNGEGQPDAIVASVRDSQDLLELANAVDAQPRRPGIVALVTGRDPELVADGLRGGVNAIVERDALPELISDAVGISLAGHSVIPQWAAGVFAARIPQRPPSDQWVSNQEVEWLRLLADGMTVGALASRIGYSEREMFRNLHDLYTRIKVKSRTGALLWAERHGLLAPPESKPDHPA